MDTQGTRRDIDDSEWTTAEIWDYGKITHNDKWFWYCCVPVDGKPKIGNLSDHDIIEHDDKSLTVSPSILTWDGNGHEWHGYLEHGIWRAV